MNFNNLLKLVFFIVISQLAGIVGSVFTISSIPTWYSTLQKPSFSPPNWVFGPAWIILYLLMGISAFLVWSKDKRTKTALRIFICQLVLNALWSIIFFGFHNPFWAFIEIIALWLAILATILSFYRISRSAAYLLLPYILWVSFASVLNLSIVILN